MSKDDQVRQIAAIYVDNTISPGLSDKIRQDQTRLYISSNDNCSEKCIVVQCVHGWKEYHHVDTIRSQVARDI
jgi:hypothetical protein